MLTFKFKKKCINWEENCQTDLLHMCRCIMICFNEFVLYCMLKLICYKIKMIIKEIN